MTDGQLLQFAPRWLFKQSSASVEELSADIAPRKFDFLKTNILSLFFRATFSSARHFNNHIELFSATFLKMTLQEASSHTS